MSLYVTVAKAECMQQRILQTGQNGLAQAKKEDMHRNVNTGRVGRGGASKNR